MDKTKAYQKVSRQLTAILKGMDGWDDLKVFRKAVAMGRSEEFRLTCRRLMATKRFKEFTRRAKERWPGWLWFGGLTPDHLKHPYPEAFLDARKEWVEKHEKDEQRKAHALAAIEQERERYKKAGRI